MVMVGHQERAHLSCSMPVDKKTQGTVFCLLQEDPGSAALWIPSGSLRHRDAILVYMKATRYICVLPCYLTRQETASAHKTVPNLCCWKVHSVIKGRLPLDTVPTLPIPSILPASLPLLAPLPWCPPLVNFPAIGWGADFEHELWAFLPRVTVSQQPARPASEQGDGNSADEWRNANINFPFLATIL